MRFTVDSALLSELGEKLVESVHLALVELVKNAYDADSTKVLIKFVGDEKNIKEIHIIDDGTGMTHDQVKDYWMRIATTNKKESIYSPKFGRPRTGAKGIGRFCCRRLGETLRLLTTAKNGNKFEKTDVLFEWKKKFTEGSDVTEIDCPGTQIVFPDGRVGTKLIIGDTVPEWTTISYQYIKRKLAVLVANRGIQRDGYDRDPGFQIGIEAPQFAEELEDLREQFYSAGWGTLTANINKQGQAECGLLAQTIGTQKYTSSKTFALLNGVTLKIGIMVDDRLQMRDTSVLSQGSLKQILTDWGGVQVRHRGFRVGNYGDDDWLNINRDRGLRRAAPKSELKDFANTLKGIDSSRALLNLLSMQNYLGHVQIGEDNTNFEMKANREGFINSHAFLELHDFVRLAIEWATILREFAIRERAKKNAEVARQILEENLGEEVSSNQVIPAAIKYINKEVGSILNYLPKEEKREVQKAFVKATDAILKREISNQEELKHLRLIASTSTIVLIFSHEVRSLLGLLENNINTIDIVKDKTEELDSSDLVNLQNDLISTKERFGELLDLTAIVGINSKKAKKSNLALKERVERAAKTFRLIIDEYEIDIDLKDIQPNVIIHDIYEAELYAILLNVISNSIKSVIAAKNEMRIKIEAYRENKRNIINIHDTGVGLKEEFFEEVFTPFIADPDNNLYVNLDNNMNPADKDMIGTGSGLGLSIIKEIISVHEGEIRFKKPVKNWNANLEIILK